MYRVDSPKITQETKSKDFDPSVISSPRTGRRKNVHNDEVSPASFLNRYLIENDNFAKGAYGKVSLALDKITKERVVIKKIAKSTPIRMIQNEVRAGQLLASHEYIATFHKYQDFFDHHQMVFQYVDGMDLFTYLEGVNFTPQPEDFVRSILSNIISALQHCHSKNIAHRDIKLENILIGKNGKSYLIDFGLCGFMDGKKSREWCGSDNYIPPEIVRRISYDGFQADIFSIGVVAFALVFGVFPFENLSVNSKYSHNPARPLPRLHVRFPLDVPVSASVKDLLVRMLEDDTDKRITLPEIAKHEWMTGIASSTESSPTESSTEAPVPMVIETVPA